jgi:hypothetical protein
MAWNGTWESRNEGDLDMQFFFALRMSPATYAHSSIPLLYNNENTLN